MGLTAGIRSLFALVRPLREEQEDNRSALLKPLAGMLTQVGRELDDLNESTGNDFVAMGDELKDFHARANALFGRSGEIVELMSGQGLSRATDGLSAILDGLKSHIHESDGHLGMITAELERYLEGLHKTFMSLESFESLVLSLNMLGFLTRVENAHVFTESTGFSSLAADVKKLGESIREKSTAIRRRAGEARATIDRALTRVHEFRKGTGTSAEDMLATAQHNHRMLEEKYAAASASARLITDRMAQAASSIADIVMSLQVHDITRQQIMHVRDILQSLGARVSTGGDAGRAELVHEIASLQKSQLQNSREDIVRAAQNVQCSLGAIGGSLSGVLSETRHVAWASGNEGVSFMESLDHGISSIIESINANAAEQASLTDMVSSADVLISGMSQFVKEIDSLGMALQLIALNARIRAAGLGEEGAALDIVSGAIYELSKNAREDTLVLSNLLSELVGTSGAFDRDLGEIRRKSEEKVESMVENLHELTHALHTINGSVLESLSDMAGEGEALIRDIERTVGEIRVHEVVEKVLEGVMGSLEDVRDRASGLCPERDVEGARAFLAGLGDQYTMESEREIHTRHLSGRGPDMDAPAGGVEPAADLGDNVELF
jgi:hypothetical protein